MNGKFLFLSLVGLSFLVSSSTFGNPINVTMNAVASVIAAPKSAIGDYGDGTVLDWIKADVSAYNTLESTTYPAPTANLDKTALLKVTTGDDSTGSGPDNIDLTLGTYDYVFLHWGGKSGGSEQLYYIGGLTGTFDFLAPPGGHPDVGGLSFYSFYGPETKTVPDVGSTLFMLGAALSGLGLMAHCLKH